jgi:EmrB/QacA subfamily drug resistance transporter
MTIAIPKLDLSKRSDYKWWAFLAIAVGTFTTVADNGSIGVALPTIASYFRIDLPTTQWVAIGYTLTVSALLLPMGRLSDIAGRKQVYLAGFALFVAGALLAGTSGSILSLILFKVLMGLGAAMTQGTAMAMVLSAFPDSERGKALGLQLSVVGTGNVVGPAVGGFIIGVFGWRAVFFGDAFLGTMAVLSALVVLDGRRFSQTGGARATFDWPGAALSTAILVTFLLAVTNGQRLGWDSPFIGSAFALLVGLVAAFIWWELRTPSPMLDVRLFRRRLFTLGVSSSFISFIGMSSVRFLMPFYLQAVKGYTPGQVGLIIVPSALMMIIMGPLTGRLSDRYGWRTFTIGGLLMSVAGLFLLSTLKEGSPLAVAMAGMMLQTGGTGTFNAPNNSSVLSTVEKSRYGVMSGFLNLVRNASNVTGVAVATAIVTATMASMGQPPTLAAVSGGGDASLRAFTSGLHVAYLAIACLVLVGVLAQLIREGRAEKTPPAQRTGAG